MDDQADIELLRETLEQDPGNTKCWLELARSYADTGQFKEAADAYARRAYMGGGAEEAWYARLQEARCLRSLGDEGGFIRAALAAFNQRPDRAEPLYDLARYYRERGMNDASVLFCEPGLSIPRPPDGTPFLEELVYSAGLREEYSIAANYARDKTRRDRGHTACEWLALNRQLPSPTRGLARLNLVFYARSLGELASSFAAHRIAFDPPTGWSAINPGITRYRDQTWCVIRCVNYTLRDDGGYTLPPGENFKTRNYLAQLDDDLQPVSVDEIAMPSDWPEPLNSGPKGFEDCRLFVWRGDLWVSATMSERTPEGWCEIALARIERSANGPRFADWHILAPAGPKRNEKNWMPWVEADTLRFVYFLDPLRILDDAAQTVRESDAAVALDHLRGGPPLLQFDGGWLTLMHEVAVLGHVRRYLHRWVWLDRDGTVQRVSEAFVLLKCEGEFSCGLSWHPDAKRLVICFGRWDPRGEAWIVTVSATDVSRMLTPVEQRSDVTARIKLWIDDDVRPGVTGVTVGNILTEQTSGPAELPRIHKSHAKNAQGTPTLSISCIETRNIDKAVHAVERTAECVPTDSLYWFSPHPYPGKFPGKQVVNIHINDFNDFFDDINEVCLRLMPRVITTDFSLVVQADGFAVNAQAWDEAFLEYDYVGAPWPWMWGGGPYWPRPIVGNGGFSLRSQKLFRALRDLDIKWRMADWAHDERLGRREYYGVNARKDKFLPEDALICHWYREVLETKYGIRFCPPDLANKFSVETVHPFTQYWLGRSFGFHGIVAAPHYGICL